MNHPVNIVIPFLVCWLRGMRRSLYVLHEHWSTPLSCSPWHQNQFLLCSQYVICLSVNHSSHFVFLYSCLREQNFLENSHVFYSQLLFSKLNTVLFLWEELNKHLINWIPLIIQVLTGFSNLSCLHFLSTLIR